MAAPVPPGRATAGAAPVDEARAEAPLAGASGAGSTASRLRNLRVDVQTLQDVLDRVRKGEADLKDSAGYFANKVKSISQGLAPVTGDDSLQRLHNIWDQIKSNPILQTPTATFDAHTLIQNLNFLDDLCRQFILQVGLITIPERLESWLSRARPGYYIPFHIVFADEIPTYADRVSVLEFLAIQPPDGALIDVEAGLIYRYSTKPWERAASILLLLAALLVAGGLVVGICFLPIHGIPEWKLDPTSAVPLMIAWLAVVVGVLIHVAVSLNKRARQPGQRPPVLAIVDLPLLINAHSGQILLKLVLTLVGVFGLAFTVGAGELSPPIAFLVGYSLDSFVELFTSQVERQSTAQLEALRHLQGGSASGAG